MRALLGAGVMVFAGAIVVVALSEDWAPGAHARTAVPPTAPPVVVSRPPPGPPALAHRTAYVPPQCYARTRHVAGTRDGSGCFACHQASREPNYVDDAAAQLVLSVPAAATTNPWQNLVTPPPAPVIADAALLAYIRTDNYRYPSGEPRLGGVPGGFGADCAFAADAAGWDRTPDGDATGWRAYRYAPMPGMFWPTNGSMGDAYVRLPEPYRRDAAGHDSLAVYAINLAIVEAYVRRADVAIAATAETPLAVDLDHDGRLGIATHVAYVWPPDPARAFHYVGAAAGLDQAAWGFPAAGLVPTGTEFVHSLHYLDVVDGVVTAAARFKELRYLRKLRWLTYSQLALAAAAEAREAESRPDATKRIAGDAVLGVATGTGWRAQGYIEAADGTLRPQSVEETAACIGCHGGVGATTDSTFSFARKSTDAHSWQSALADLPLAEPVRADGRGEYTAWLEAMGAGDDYRSNAELFAQAFGKDGHVRPSIAKSLGRDIRAITLPSATRALALDRAYLGIVRAQSFTAGRDAIVGSPAIEATLVQDAATGVTAPLALD